MAFRLFASLGKSKIFPLCFVILTHIVAYRWLIQSCIHKLKSYFHSFYSLSDHEAFWLLNLRILWRLTISLINLVQPTTNIKKTDLHKKSFFFFLVSQLSAYLFSRMTNLIKKGRKICRQNLSFKRFCCSQSKESRWVTHITENTDTKNRTFIYHKWTVAWPRHGVRNRELVFVLNLVFTQTPRSKPWISVRFELGLHRDTAFEIVNQS